VTPLTREDLELDLSSRKKSKQLKIEKESYETPDQLEYIGYKWPKVWAFQPMHK